MSPGEFTKIPSPSTHPVQPPDPPRVGPTARFRTADDVDVPPLRLTGVSLSPESGGSVRMRIECPEGARPHHVGMGRLRLHFSGDSGRWLRRCLLS